LLQRAKWVGLVILSTQSSGKQKECSVRLIECCERPQSGGTGEARRSHPKSAEFVAKVISEYLSELEPLIFEECEGVAFGHLIFG
jgi:hypothetical protein